MKSLETKETKGFFFVVADDLRGASNLKSEGQRRTIFSILRHFQRIKEIRGPAQLVRYAMY
jgi:fructose-1,6-bisphosphatase